MLIVAHWNIAVSNNYQFPLSDMICERNALMEHTYPKLKDFCRKHGLEFQVTLKRSKGTFIFARTRFLSTWVATM